MDKNLLDLLPCNVFLKDRNGVYCGCNKSLLTSFQVTEADFIGKTIFDFLPGKTAARIAKADAELIATGVPQTSEEEGLFNGIHRIFFSKRIPLYDDHQNITGLLGVAFDVTEYKTHEREAIKQKLTAEDTLNKVINLLPGHVYWYNVDGTMYGMNNQQAINLGFTCAQDAIGKNLYKILSEKDALLVKGVNDAVVMTKTVVTAEEPVTFLNAPDPCVMLSRKAPWYDENGQAIGVIGVSLDITEQKNLEKQLEIAKTSAESTLENIIAMLPANVYWQDQNDVILGCNDHQAQALGFQSHLDVIGKINKDADSKKVMEAGQVLTLEEKRTEANDQSTTYLSKKAPLRDKEGNIIGTIGISFDITEQKEAEAIRLKNTIIEENLKISKIQAASIAHELRTPLGATAFLGSIAGDIIPEVMKGYQLALEAGLLEKKLKPFQLQAFQEIPKDLLRIARGANTFIDMLLMKVNLENKHARSEELKEFMIGPVIAEALKMYPLPEAYSREDIEFNPENDFVAKADPIFVRHIIFNLLKNAIHYVLKAGKGKIAIWMERSIDHNILHFQDTGSGMPSHVLEHVFSPFFTKTHHGTGVGLALCAMFMEEFGGKISCDSAEGEYTHFKMEFPAAP